MTRFKPLEWCAQEYSPGAYAEPNGLKWSYSITIHRNGKIKYALLDSNLEYENGFPEICNSITEAKAKATQHYQSLLENFVVQ